MIGLVVVSHSAALAHAAVDLAWAMVPGERPALEVAAGAGVDDAGAPIIGTDAVAVSEAIRVVAEAARDDGVLVLMDLGSAVLSAELALELAADVTAPVRLSAAPLVEGLVAAVVRAAGGASLAEVASEARGALAAKAAQLSEPDEDAAPVGASAAPAGSADGTLTARLTLRNPTGLHARPVATLVTALGALDASVTVSNPRTGRGPVRANSTIALLTLGAAQGDEIEVEASGPAAAEALQTVERLVDEGFGEL